MSKIEIVRVEAQLIAATSSKSSSDPQKIAAAIGSAYAQIGAFMHVYGLTQAGAPITIDRSWDEGHYEFDAAIPIDRRPDVEVPADSPVRVTFTYAGRVLKAVHVGSYATLRDTFAELHAYMAANGLESGGFAWMEYVSDPGHTPEDQLITHLYLPLR